MTIGEFPNPTIKIDGQEIETVDRFTNLGSIVDVNGGTDADVKSRINKARHAFAVHINKLAYTKCRFPLSPIIPYMEYARFHICRSTIPVSSWQTKWRTKVQAFAGEAHNPLCYLEDYDLQVAEEKVNCI